MNILFVCTGNTCRSPMTEAIFNRIVSDRGISGFTADSRGISVYASDAVNPKAVNALETVGISGFEHVSQKISAEDVKNADLILAMTQMQKEMLITYYKDEKYKIFTIMEYIYNKKTDVDDPYGKSQVVYNICVKDLYTVVSDLVSHLEEDFGE